MKEWYFKLKEFRPEVGFEFEFEGGPPEKSYIHRCQVTEVIPQKKLGYSWRFEGYKGDSLVTFELFPDGEKTKLRLTHSDLATFIINKNPDLNTHNFAAGWADIIGRSLKEFVEASDRTISATNSQNGHYAIVNGVRMYYEVHGSGYPLVLLHGGGSTIESSFGRILPELVKTHKVIAVELQAHGHTLDIDRPLSFEQDADDLASLLEQIHISKADVMGFSNGGTTALQIAIRHPQIVNKLVLCSATYKRSGMVPRFFEGFEHATLDNMPKPLQAAYLKANPDLQGLKRMFERDVARMKAFTDIPDSAIQAIQSPALVINSDQDVVMPEHALELSRLLAHGQLAILPGAHGEYIGEICSRDPNSKIPSLVTAIIESFLKA